jgi:hypothetical protein
MRVCGYFDASGWHDNKDNRGNHSPAIIVAGFLSTPHKWQQFDKKWKQMLADANVSCFHATDLIGKKREFTGWSSEQVHLFIGKALEIIDSCVLFGLSMSVLRDDYNKAIDLHPEVKNILGTPYNFCTMRCWESGVDWARKLNYDDAIKYIFEQGDKQQHDILKAHAYLSSDKECREFWRFGIGQLTFAEKVKTTPLQAADFLAYAMYKNQYRISYTPTESQRLTTKTFLRIPGTHKYYVEQHLHEYIQDAVDEYNEKKSDKAT